MYMAGQEQELSWRVASHRYREHSNDWFWGLGVIALVGAVASVIFGNILLAMIIVLGAVSLGMLSKQQPREHAVQIDRRGIVIDGTRYPYSSVRSFWVAQTDQSPQLFVSLMGLVAPHLSIELAHEVEAERVRAFLKQYAEEVEQGPQLGEQLLQIFGL